MMLKHHLHQFHFGNPSLVFENYLMMFDTYLRDDCFWNIERFPSIITTTI
jgi:hypothetical protein